MLCFFAHENPFQEIAYDVYVGKKSEVLDLILFPMVALLS